MQQRFLVVLALWAALLVPAAALSAASQARLFLRNHADKPVEQDQLAELKSENPDAYALVKALLTKRSLGLLNARHPTASFAPVSAEQQKAQQSAEQGPEVFSNMLKPGELEAAHVHQDSAAPQASKVALPYAEVQPAQHLDEFNWKPQASALNDDEMVQNVLGAVAELKGGKKASLRQPQGLAADEASFSVESPPPAPKAAATAPAPQENSYLKSIDFGIRTPEAPVQAAQPKENSYLKGLDLSADMPGAKRTSLVHSSSTDDLASFSWDDSKPVEQPKRKVVAQPEAQGNSHSNTLLSWLGVVKQAPPPQAVEAEPAKPKNPYLMDLSN